MLTTCMMFHDEHIILWKEEIKKINGCLYFFFFSCKIIHPRYAFGWGGDVAWRPEKPLCLIVLGIVGLGAEGVWLALSSDDMINGLRWSLLSFFRFKSWMWFKPLPSISWMLKRKIIVAISKSALIICCLILVLDNLIWSSSSRSCSKFNKYGSILLDDQKYIC